MVLQYPMLSSVNRFITRLALNVLITNGQTKATIENGSINQ